MTGTLAITDCRIPKECEKRLGELGFTVLKLPSHPRLGKAVRSHVDMLIFKHGDTVITTKEYYGIAKEVFDKLFALRPKLRLLLTDEVVCAEYPNDCILNTLEINGALFCRSETVSRCIKELAEAEGLKTVSVKQGYPACTVLNVGGRLAITADSGMARALAKEGISVQLINNGGISLPPYEYGFIGGCAGYRDGKVYFLGDPMTHPDGKTITDSIRRAGLEYEALYPGTLLDLGGILFA